MKYCNPIQDFSAYLCNIPFQWRDAIAQALNCAYSAVLSANVDVEVNGNCEGIQDCQTNTQFNITLVNNILTAHFVNERNITIIRNTDLIDAINNALDNVDPKCLMTQEEWDELTYQERMAAIFDKVCCAHNNCTGISGSGCGCDDCGDEDVECIGIEACPCVTYEVTGTAPFTFSYKDCESKEIVEYNSIDDNIVEICAIRGTVVTTDGVFCNEIADTCFPETTTTTTSSSTTTTTAAPTTTTTTSSTTTTSTSSTTTTTTIIPPPTTTTTTSSTTTTTTIIPPPTTTTTSSTTTTTTADPFWTYYLADEYTCTNCTVFSSNILVRIPTSHVVQVGNFYLPIIFAGLVYKILTGIPQLAGGSVSLTTQNELTCADLCGRRITDAIYSNNLGTHCAQSINTVYTDDGTIFPGKTIYIDAALTNPLLGYTFISDDSVTVVYNLNSVNGVVGSNSGMSC